MWKKLHELEINRAKSGSAAGTSAANSVLGAGVSGGSAAGSQQNSNSYQQQSNANIVNSGSGGGSGDNNPALLSGGAQSGGTSVNASGTNAFAKVKGDKTDN